MRLFLASIGDLDGRVSVAKVKSFELLLELKKPSPNFLKKLSKPPPDDSTERIEAEGEPHDNLQEQGLNMLVEDAEVHGREGDRPLDTEELNEEGFDDVEEPDDEEGEFRMYMQQGLERAFATSDAHEDEDLEKRFEANLSQSSSQAVASAYEQRLAHAAINGGSCNIDLPEQQQKITFLQNVSGLDPVEAAVETAFASALGVEAVPSDDDEAAAAGQPGCCWIIVDAGAGDWSQSFHLFQHLPKKFQSQESGALYRHINYSIL